jgi:hypothetical protein
MVTRRLALIMCGASVLGLAVATVSGASSLAVRTNYLTFSGAVALPGVTLPRGTYMFEAVDLHPGVVRVLSRDGSRTFFMGLTRGVTRPAELHAGRLVTFAETARDVPPRIQAWYPVGDSLGRQFIYPDATR